MKNFPIITWLTCAGLTILLATTSDEPLHAVTTPTVHVTLKNLSLERPEVVSMENVTPNAPETKSEDHHLKMSLLNTSDAPLPPRAQAALDTPTVTNERCRIWGPWSERDMGALHKMLGPRDLEKNMRMVRTSLANEYGIYMVVGQTRQAAEHRWNTLKKSGIKDHVVTHFPDEGWGILFGRFQKESDAQQTAQALAETQGLKHLNILQFGHRNEVLVDLLFENLDSKDIAWLETEARRHTGTTLRPCLAE